MEKCMNLSLKILETNQIIQKEILQALLPQVDIYMTRIMGNLKEKLPPIVSKAITNRPEYMSLVSGRLRLELGIPDASTKVSQLIQIWISNIQYTYKKPQISGGAIKSSFSASLIKNDFSDVTNTEAGSVQDNIRGYSLPWLEWLLLDGNRTIVPNQSVVIGPNNSSRTGMAIMRESPGGWKVPAEFTGTINDNWITRAIEDAAPDINNLLNRIMKS
jgi:hypothetical protein